MRFLDQAWRTAGLACAIAGLACGMTAAHGQAYPSKPIRVVVPFPPGGADVIARIITNKMVEFLGQPMIIDNRAGANGNIGSEFVARAAPDGYTLLVTTSTTMISGYLLTRNVPFDPMKDFTPVGNMYDSVATLAVAARVPAANLTELIDYAKRNPGKLNFGSIGSGSTYHLNGEIFKRAAGIDIVHVPYKGTAPMTTALVAGEVEMAFPSIPNLGSNIGPGKVKVMAMLDPRRHPRVPDAPAMQEVLPQFRKAPNWIAMFGPAGLSQAIVARLNSEMNRALNVPEVRNNIEQLPALIIGGSAADLAAAMKGDMESTISLIKTIGLKPE